MSNEVGRGDDAGHPSRWLLDGLRIVDLSLWQPGHTATQLLADLGAEVLKVEPPGGDRMRAMADRFANFDRHKRSVVLDLKQEEGRRRLLTLVAEAEVVVEGFRPGVAERLGASFETLRSANPAIVLCSITGFGRSGPLASVPGHDRNYQAYAGAFTFSHGQAPAAAGLLVGDQGSGLAAAFAILASVLCARRTGVGEHVDVSIADLLASWVAPLGSLSPSAPALILDMLPGMGTFRTGDGGYVELGVFSEDHLWDALCEALEVNDGVGLGFATRTDRAGELRAALASAIDTWNRDDLIDALRRRSLPVAPVLTREEMLELPHFQERGVITVGPDGARGVRHPIQYTLHPSRPDGTAPLLDDRSGEGFGWSHADE